LGHSLLKVLTDDGLATLAEEGGRGRGVECFDERQVVSLRLQGNDQVMKVENLD